MLHIISSDLFTTQHYTLLNFTYRCEGGHIDGCGWSWAHIVSGKHGYLIQGAAEKIVIAHAGIGGGDILCNQSCPIG